MPTILWSKQVHHWRSLVWTSPVSVSLCRRLGLRSPSWAPILPGLYSDQVLLGLSSDKVLPTVPLDLLRSCCHRDLFRSNLGAAQAIASAGHLVPFLPVSETNQLVAVGNFMSRLPVVKAKSSLSGRIWSRLYQGHYRHRWLSSSDNRKRHQCYSIVVFHACCMSKISVLYFFANSHNDGFDLRQRLFLNYTWANRAIIEAFDPIKNW